MFTISIICLSLWYIFKPRKEKVTDYIEPEKQTKITPNYIDVFEEENHVVCMSVEEFKELQDYEERAMIEN